MVFVLSRCRCTSAKRTNNGLKKTAPMMVDAPIVQTMHLHAEANPRVKYTVTPFHVQTLAVVLPGDKILDWYFTDTSGLELACTSVCRHAGTNDFYSQASLPRVAVNAVALALALIGRMNFQYLILAAPPNCDRHIVSLLPFLSLYTFLY